MTIKSPTNRQIQTILKTYKTKNEIFEALCELRPHINESTYKFLCYFLKTDHGVTQAKIIVICKKVGISLATFYKVVKREIDTLFGESIVEIRKAPKKLDHSRSKRVQASAFKILLPLKKIKYLVKKFIKAQEKRASGIQSIII